MPKVEKKSVKRLNQKKSGGLGGKKPKNNAQGKKFKRNQDQHASDRLDKSAKPFVQKERKDKKKGGVKPHIKNPLLFNVTESNEDVVVDEDAENGLEGLGFLLKMNP